MPHRLFCLGLILWGCGVSTVPDDRSIGHDVPSDSEANNQSEKTGTSQPISEPPVPEESTPKTPSQPTCEDMPECKTHGRCVRERYRCAAQSDEHCRNATEICGVRGECRWCGDRCCAREPSDCADSTGCVQDGLCRPHMGHCLASTAGCRASTGCTTEGRCVPHSTDVSCTVQSVADCRASTACTKDKRCRLSKLDPETEHRHCIR